MANIWESWHNKIVILLHSIHNISENKDSIKVWGKMWHKLSELGAGKAFWAEPYVTEPKWGLSFPLPPIGKFQGQGLVRKERGLYSNAVQSGKMTDPCLEAHLFWKTQRKTQPPSVRPTPKATSRVPSPIQSTIPWEMQVATDWSSTQASGSILGTHACG